MISEDSLNLFPQLLTRPLTVFCGVDFHARLQTVSYMDISGGSLHQRDLHHQKGDVRAFYSQFTGEVIVGLEARS